MSSQQEQIAPMSDTNDEKILDLPIIEDGFDYDNPVSSEPIQKQTVPDDCDDQPVIEDAFDFDVPISSEPIQKQDNLASDEKFASLPKPPRIPVADLPGSLKGRVEAVLFITGRPLQIGEIAEKLHAHYDDVEEAVLTLINDYSYREDSALEIDDTDGYILQVRGDYTDVVTEMLPADISLAALRTLSAIALKGPMLQSKLVEIRGSAVYDHIKELVRQQLVSKKREQSSYTLRVTTKFHRYFRIEANQLTSILLANH